MLYFGAQKDIAILQLQKYFFSYETTFGKRELYQANTVPSIAMNFRVFKNEGSGMPLPQYPFEGSLHPNICHNGTTLSPENTK